MAKTRKTYTAEFKHHAVRMVADQHLAVAEAARRLGVSKGRSKKGSGFILSERKTRQPIGPSD